MRMLIGFLIVVMFSGAVQAAPVASAKSYGYRNDDAAKYNRLVGKYAGKDCRWLKAEYGKASKLAGKTAKGTGIQVMGALLGRGSKGGLAAEIGGNVVKDAALRRDAAQAVFTAKKCR